MQRLVAVTGATGFVGGHLVSSLLEAGYRVRVLVRDAAKLRQAHDQLEIIFGDVTDGSALQKFVGDADVVVHCAGAIMARDRDRFFAVNQGGAENVAMAAKVAGVKKFILVSSLAAREPQLSDYAASKRAGEESVGKILSGEQLVIVRPPAVYGPGDKATLALIRALTQKLALLPGRRDQRVSLIYVEDLAKLLVHLAGGHQVFEQPLEVDDGCSSGYSFADLARLAGKAQGCNIRLVLLPRWLVSAAGFVSALTGRIRARAVMLTPQKVRELYHRDWVAKPSRIDGWKPAVQFAEGFGQTLNWYQKNQWLPGAGGTATSHCKSDYGDTSK